MEKSNDSNNLAQIGIALHDYHEKFGSFPSGAIPNPDLPPTKRLSWIVELLPLIEEEKIYRSIDREKGWGAEGNAPAVGQTISILTLSNDKAAITHYVGMAGIGLDAPELLISDPRAGVFGYDRKTRLADIKDGAAYTMMVIQTAHENGPWAAGGPATVRAVDTNDRPYIGRNRQFGGTFRGGVNAVFADASVRWIKDSIDPEVFEALATIAGGEKVEIAIDY